MVWSLVEHETTTPHVSYAVMGFALVLFGTISLFVKEKLYLGEATTATIYGLIIGPHCLKWWDPTKWGNSDYIALELSRIVLIVQIFAVAVELPKKYMLKHWFSVTMLLLPVMTFGWLVSSVFIWKLVPSLRWIHGLCIAGCVTATDPVLAAAVVGKGKFAQRVPGHLRNLLSAESGCNDGMAFPFVIMAVDIIRAEHHPREIAKNFICIGVLYECVLGILIGAVIGYGSRHLIKFAEKMRFIDRESFLAYYFCVALFCAGVGTLCGVDDLLVAFAAGAAFSWDGWFARETEESQVSNVIDMLLNTAFFVYFGAIVPWPDFNNAALGIRAWKLVCLAIIILVVRRLPIMLAIKPITPDIHTWREAVFCGHFGPIGVGAIFMALLARAQLENNTERPDRDLPAATDPNYYVIACIWPVTCFLVIASIIVHGSSIAVFTLGKRINNMAITLTYTTTTGGQPSWMSRLPQRDADGRNMLQLKRVETEDPISRRFRRHRRAAAPQTNAGDDLDAAAQGATAEIPHDGFRNEGRHAADNNSEDGDREDERARRTLDLRLRLPMEGAPDIDITQSVAAEKLEGLHIGDIRGYLEGDHVAVEDDDGNFIHMFDIGEGKPVGEPQLEILAPSPGAQSAAGSSASTVESAETREHYIPSKDDSSPESSGGGYGSEYGESFEGGDGDGGDGDGGDGDGAGADGAGAGAGYGRGHASSRARRRHGEQRPRQRSLRRRGSRIGAPVRGIKAYATIIDDTVVVENEDGEILRRYKYVPRADGHKAHPDFGSGDISKGWGDLVPAFVKRKLGWGRSGGDLEKAPEDALVPEGPPLSTAASMALSEKDERQLQRTLSTMLRSGTVERRHSQVGRNLMLRPETMPSENAVTDDDDEGVVPLDDDEEGVVPLDADDADEPETSVERHRRLAALGIIDTGDENDAARENGDDDEPKITFKLPKRPE